MRPQIHEVARVHRALQRRSSRRGSGLGGGRSLARSCRRQESRQGKASGAQELLPDSRPRSLGTRGTVLPAARSGAAA